MNVRLDPKTKAAIQADLNAQAARWPEFDQLPELASFKDIQPSDNLAELSQLINIDAGGEEVHHDSKLDSQLDTRLMDTRLLDSQLGELNPEVIESGAEPLDAEPLVSAQLAELEPNEISRTATAQNATAPNGRVSSAAQAQGLPAFAQTLPDDSFIRSSTNELSPRLTQLSQRLEKNTFYEAATLEQQAHAAAVATAPIAHSKLRMPTNADMHRTALGDLLLLSSKEFFDKGGTAELLPALLFRKGATA